MIEAEHHFQYNTSLNTEAPDSRAQSLTLRYCRCVWAESSVYHDAPGDDDAAADAVLLPSSRGQLNYRLWASVPRKCKK